jgi:hypothetical protein
VDRKQTVNNAILEVSNKFESNWEQFDFYGLGKDRDTALGLGSFFFKAVSNRSPSGKWCTAFQVADRYMFDLIPRANQGLFNDQEMADLRRTELAQNFDFFARIDYGS